MIARDRAHRSGRGDGALWWRWTRATALGELVGFAVPTLVGLTVLLVHGEPQQFDERLAFSVLMTLAGMGEGTVLGAAQATAPGRTNDTTLPHCDIPTVRGSVRVSVRACAW